LREGLTLYVTYLLIWIAPQALAQSSILSDFYDPTSPLFPTERQECTDFRDKMNSRIIALRKQHEHCGQQAKEQYDLTGWNRAYRRHDFSGCPAGTRTTFTVKECAPAWQTYCQAWDKRDKETRACFESLAKAVPDDSEELIALYEKIGKERNDSGVWVKRCGTHNPTDCSTGKQLAKKLFEESMGQLASIHKKALADLAQARARLRDQDRRAREQREYAASKRVLDRQRTQSQQRQRQVKAIAQSCKNGVYRSYERCNAQCSREYDSLQDEMGRVFRYGPQSAIRANREARDRHRRECEPGCSRAYDTAKSACERDADASAILLAEEQRQTYERQKRNRDAERGRESARQKDELIRGVTGAILGGSSGTSSSVPSRCSSTVAWSRATCTERWSKDPKVCVDHSCPTGQQLREVACTGGANSNSKICRAIKANKGRYAVCERVRSYTTDCGNR